MSVALFRARRRLLRLTQAELGRLTGLSVPTIRALETGRGTTASAARAMGALGLVWAWPETVTEPPGPALARLRRAAGLSQRDLGRAAGVSQPALVALETRMASSLPVVSAVLQRLGQPEILRDPAAPQRRLVPPPNGSGADLVFTPETLAQRIVDRFAPGMRGTVLDPARGDGAFFAAFPDHVTRLWCERADGRDFLAWTRPVSWVVTNPPWSQFRQFLTHAMAISDNVLFLAPLNHFTTRARVAAIRAAGFGLRRIIMVPRPTGWPGSGFQLAAVHLRRGWTRGCQIEDLEGPRPIAPEVSRDTLA